jgi:hypothetical protein
MSSEVEKKINVELSDSRPIHPPPPGVSESEHSPPSARQIEYARLKRNLHAQILEGFEGFEREAVDLIDLLNEYFECHRKEEVLAMSSYLIRAHTGLSQIRLKINILEDRISRAKETTRD